MIIISPSVSNFANLAPTADYTASISGISLNVQSSKTVSAAKTIGGGASVTVWADSISTETREFTVKVNQQTYEKLLRIKQSGINEWLVRAGGKRLLAVVDMPFAIRDNATGLINCQLRFVFTGEA